jgi:hypothetical protein
VRGVKNRPPTKAQKSEKNPYFPEEREGAKGSNQSALREQKGAMRSEKEQ